MGFYYTMLLLKVPMSGSGKIKMYIKYSGIFGKGACK
jgi:hypothetical protein